MLIGEGLAIRSGRTESWMHGHYSNNSHFQSIIALRLLYPLPQAPAGDSLLSFPAQQR